MSVPPRTKTTEASFWSKVDMSGPGECWLWTAFCNGDGYGVFRFGRTSMIASRWAYQQAFGPLPPGMTVDHIHHCSRRCVYPGHLRAATRRQQNENLKGAVPGSRSGVRGVYPTHFGRWYGSVSNIYVGTFDTVEQAEAAVIAKRLELFTHNEVDKARAGRALKR